MALVRLLSIPRGQTRDADGYGVGDNWELADLGYGDDGTHHYLTTDHAHASDACDDDVLSLGSAELGRFLVDALNSRGWRWVKHDPPLAFDFVLVPSGDPDCPVTVARMDDDGEWVDSTAQEVGPPVQWRPLPDAPPPRRQPYTPPPPVPFVAPDPVAKNCGTCRHWSAVMDMADDPDDTVGVCNNRLCPWDTPERRESHAEWAAGFNAGEEHPCHQVKP